MNCELAQEQIALAVYGELPEELAQQLEQHMAACEACRHEFQAVEALAKAMDLVPPVEPSANLIARTRLRLEEALDEMPRGNWLLGFSQRFSLGMHRLHSAPLAASALVAVSIAGGAWGGYSAGLHKHDASQARLILDAAQDKTSSIPSHIAGVSSIVREPNSENVEIAYNRLVPDSIHGTLDDADIRLLLLLGTQNRTNSKVRGESVDLLASECRLGHQCGDGSPVRDALMVALRYNIDPDVRMKALDGLEPYITNDSHVRDAVLESLMNDPDPSLRSQAIGLLEPVEADSSVREVLHTVAAQDNSPHIRYVSQQVLDQMPQIQ
jgi:anti-sigma factor RsiW